ncbi:MAG: STAS domain-containing protein [Alphaproteobacteria bacterium]|nr:STAS domain-containing protein [Alphaproteobacteria bacterium]
MGDLDRLRDAVLEGPRPALVVAADPVHRAARDADAADRDPCAERPRHQVARCRCRRRLARAAGAGGQSRRGGGVSAPAVEVVVTALDGGASLAVVSGRLDSATVPAIEGALLAPIQRGHGVIYDLADLTYISAAGVRLIVAAVRRAEAAQALVAFARVPAEVAETLSVSGFAMFLHMFDSREEAVAHVRGSGG